MKTIFYTLLIGFFSIICSLKSAAQTSFEKYMSMNDVTAVQATPAMFQLIDGVNIEKISTNKDASKMLNMLKNVNQIVVISSENHEKSVMMQNDFQSYIEQGKLSKLMGVNNNGKQVLFYQKTPDNKKGITEIALYLHGNKEKKKSLILLINGHLNRDNFAMISKAFKIDQMSKNLSENDSTVVNN